MSAIQVSTTFLRSKVIVINPMGKYHCVHDWSFWPHRSRRLHCRHGKLFFLWLVVSNGTIVDLYIVNIKHFENLTKYKDFKKCFDPWPILTYILFCKRNIWQIWSCCHFFPLWSKEQFDILLKTMLFMHLRFWCP